MNQYDKYPIELLQQLRDEMQHKELSQKYSVEDYQKALARAEDEYMRRDRDISEDYMKAALRLFQDFGFDLDVELIALHSHEIGVPQENET